MTRIKPIKKKLRLQGFNNLTKSLCFNLYDVAYAKTPSQRREYLEYIDEEYNGKRLTEILTECTRIIGANILNVASQDYEPQGASVTILISEEPVTTMPLLPETEVAAFDRVPEPSLVGHLDKSHICVHTYPEAHPADGICTFRADIEVSTCGRISPLHALNYLIREFDSDVMSLDYRVRGFTRDVTGRKFFMDHKIRSIQDFIDRDILRQYQAYDVNVYQENLFHTQLMWKKVDLDRYVFTGSNQLGLAANDKKSVKRRLKKEIEEIFYNRNIND